MALEGPSDRNWRGFVHPKLVSMKLDLLDAGAVSALFRRVQPTVVVNCAAYGAYSNQTDVERIYAVNLTAVRHLLECARELPSLRAFIQTGSSSEYGRNCRGPGEDSATTPDSHYAVSKVAATASVQFYAHKHDVPGWVVRLYSVYGPYEDGSRLIPKLLLSAREGKLPPLVDPRISRDFIHVDDVSRLVHRVIERAPQLEKGRIYNVGSGTCSTLERAVETVRREFGVTQPPAWGSMPNRHWYHPDWFANPARAEHELGWRAELSLSEGLRQTMAWMNANPEAVEGSLSFSVAAGSSR